jgi:hypothetical protein
MLCSHAQHPIVERHPRAVALQKQVEAQQKLIGINGMIARLTAAQDLADSREASWVQAQEEHATTVHDLAGTICHKTDPVRTVPDQDIVAIIVCKRYSGLLDVGFWYSDTMRTSNASPQLLSLICCSVTGCHSVGVRSAKIVHAGAKLQPKHLLGRVSTGTSTYVNFY